ncbi:hypothetical protein L9W92_07710 [Pelotomaculum terephthalicicum JT]|uniref:hypothetical protein n=1 Tax=Pelotomaculum terephthalicicum TaxID=206393 RepID=UPI001F04FA2A|nr:hypothetical protein [Pelotomaculum terephthalicicum]MCG9967941.1 hypothetical protein [Pelotomaculum terephthalicicum JT]
MRRQTAGRIAFLASLVFFLVLSNYIGEWYVYHQMGFDSNFRFENGAHVKSDTLDLYTDYMARQKGCKIAVIGDSVVQGAGVPEGEQTITAHLEEELRGSYLPEARVFNCGFPGGRPADLYMAVKSLHEAGAVQFFMINISYPFFSDEMAKDPLLYFKVWFYQLTDEQKKELNIPAEMPPDQPVKTDSAEAAGGSAVETLLQKKISEYWSVYRFRQELNRFLFGGRPAAKGREYYDLAFKGIMPEAEEPAEQEQEPFSEKDKPENKYNVWTSFPWSEEDKAHLKKVFDVTGKDNVDFKYYRELCRYLEENEIPAVIFLSPVNHALLQRYQLLDYDAYEKNTGIIAQAALQRDIAFFNYQDAIPQELFHDSLHMLDGGNAAMAELLSRDLRPYLQGVHAR